jgi:simple sugar transport system substrate-binding protein
MKKKIDPKVDEAIETLNMKDGHTRRVLLKGTGLVSATAAASALLAACSASKGTSQAGASSSAGSTSAADVAGDFPKTPAWNFWFVNHVTTNPFFVPTQYGFADAAALLGLPKPKWGGSATSAVPQMVQYMQTAISGKADGIAVAVISSTAFTSPTASALSAGIPVVSYNADGNVLAGGKPDPGTARLAYYGQDLYQSGVQLGNKIVSLMGGGGDAVGFIATPGAGNIQPRIDGAKAAIQASGKSINLKEITSGATLPQENTTINGYILSHKSSLKGIFAVDAGSTQTVGQIVQKYSLSGKVASGGFDLTPQTLNSIKAGDLDFTIDQSPYQQGFLPVIGMFLYQLSGGLVAPSTTDTGLTFVDKTSVGPYQATTTRFEGSSTAQKLVQRSGAIAGG